MDAENSGYEERKQQKEAAEISEKRSKLFARIAKTWLPVLVVIVGVGAAVVYIARAPQIPEGALISKDGIHWHPRLTILIKGETQPIPANIGLTPIEQTIHTHETDGTLHLEFPSIVRERDTTLGRFFSIWGKEFSKTQIFDFKNGPEGTLRMTVNGVENNEFGDYKMKDKDEIVLRYE